MLANQLLLLCVTKKKEISTPLCAVNCGPLWRTGELQVIKYNIVQ